jgi:multiple sugar transport system substrate-binding protein
MWLALRSAGSIDPEAAGDEVGSKGVEQMRRLGKRVLAATLSGSIVALGALAGCGGGGGNEGSSEESQFTKNVSGELSVWGFNNADDVGKARLAYAQQQLSGVKINLDPTGFDSQKFTTRAASKTLPDVVQMDRQFVATYAAQDLILPLDQCFSLYGVDAKSYWYPAVVEDVTYKDKVWAAPQFFQPSIVLLNTRVMDAAGVKATDVDTSKNDQLIAVAQKMYKSSGGKPTTIGFDPVATGQAPAWILGFGGQVMDTSGVPTLDNPNNAKALAFLKQLYDAQGGYAKAKSFTDSFDVFGKNNQFVKDQVGAQLNAQWYLNVLTPYVKSIQIAGTPFKAQTGEALSVSGGTSFVIPAGAKNKDAACAYVINLTNEGNWMAAEQARVATLANTPGSINTGLFTGAPGPDKAIRDKFVKPSGDKGFDQAIATTYEVLDHAKSQGSSPAGQAIQTELQNAIAAVLLGQKDPTKALADAQAAAKRAYDQFGG